jgi:hypothetical protein
MPDEKSKFLTPLWNDGKPTHSAISVASSNGTVACDIVERIVKLLCADLDNGGPA